MKTGKGRCSGAALFRFRRRDSRDRDPDRAFSRRPAPRFTNNFSKSEIRRLSHRRENPAETAVQMLRRGI
jgi:hypothetical protein